MRIRSLAAAAMAATGLSVTLTGAAGAAPPDQPPPGDVLVLTCADGRAVVNPLTEEERAEIDRMRTRALPPGAAERLAEAWPLVAERGGVAAVEASAPEPAPGDHVVRGEPTPGAVARVERAPAAAAAGEGAPGEVAPGATACAVPARPAGG